MAALVNNSPYIDAGFFVIMILICLSGIAKLGLSWKCAKIQGPGLAIFLFAFAITIVRTLFTDISIKTSLVHIAIASPLLLSPLLGAAVGRSPLAQRRLLTSIIVVALCYAVGSLLLVAASNGLVQRSEVTRGVPLLFYLLATAVALRRIEFERKHLTFLVAVVAICGLAIIITAHRSLSIIWALNVSISIYRTMRRGKVIYATTAIALFLVVLFSLATTTNQYVNRLSDRMDRTVTGQRHSPRLQEITAIISEIGKTLDTTMVGKGFGAEYSYIRTQNVNFPWTGKYTHNILSYFLLVGGLALLLPALFFFTRVFALAHKMARCRKPDSTLMGLCDCVFLNIAFFMFFSGNSTVYASLVFGFLLGALSVCQLIENGR
jgi:hypothetical protein